MATWEPCLRSQQHSSDRAAQSFTTSGMAKKIQAQHTETALEPSLGTAPEMPLASHPTAVLGLHQATLDPKITTSQHSDRAKQWTQTQSWNHTQGKPWNGTQWQSSRMAKHCNQWNPKQQPKNFICANCRHSSKQNLNATSITHCREWSI